MRIKLFSTLFLALVVFSTTACVSPSRLFRRGDYYKATIASVKKLRLKPNDYRAQEVLVKAYPLAVDNLQQSIDRLQYVEEPDKYYAVVRYYGMLNTLATEISRCPKAFELVSDVVDYSEELQLARQAGAEAYYLLGSELLSMGDVESARQAVICFQNTNNFINGYKDVRYRLSQAEAESVLQIFIRKPEINSEYTILLDNFCESLVADLNRRYRLHDDINFWAYTYRGVDFYHHEVMMDFANFYIEEPRVLKKITNSYRDSVITGYANVRGERYPIYSTVNAKFTENIMEVLVTGFLNVQIVDVDEDKVIQSIRIPGEFVWATSWGTYQGDERALDDRQFEMCNRRQPIPPHPQELFIEFSHPLYDRVLNFLTDFYRRY